MDVDVSVVIPTFDRDDLLVATVASVLAQTARPREIIVVANGPNNVAASALRRFGDRVTTIATAPLGKQVARNIGIEASSAEWIATLDDDDLWRPTYLEVAGLAIADGRADIIGCDHRKFTIKGAEAITNFQDAAPGYWDGIRPLGMPGQWSYVGMFPRDRLLRRVPFYPSTMLFRRSLALAAGGYDPRMRGIPSEDLEFLSRIMGLGSVAILWDALVDYRLHAGNDTLSWTGREIGRWRIFEFIRQNHQELDPVFARALDDDLPRRRARTFDLAFEVGDFTLLDELAPMLRVQDWSWKRRVKLRLASLPRPLARPARHGLLAATGRGPSRV